MIPLQYCLYPQAGATDAKTLIECMTGAPAHEELALCRIDGILVDSEDGAWTVRASGPGSLMETCLASLKDALGTYCPDVRGDVYFMPLEKDEWIKQSWKYIAKDASAICKVNFGSLLSCEPSWNDMVCISVPSEPQQAAFQRKSLTEIIQALIAKQTGEKPEVRLQIHEQRQVDYSDALPVSPSEPEKEPNISRSSEAPLVGVNINIKCTAIGASLEPSDYVALEGFIVKPETYTSRRSNPVLTFVLADDSGSVLCKYSAKDGEELPELDGTYKIAGKMALDERRQDAGPAEPILMVEDIEEVRSENEEVLRVCQRAELHCHTKMSALDSVCDPERVVAAAKNMGHKSIAVTDHGVVYAFPAFYQAAKKNGIKAVLGMEGYLKQGEGDETSHFSILVKDKLGLTNLYKMVSSSHLEHFRRHPLVPRKLASELRNGLLFGSACAGGEIFKMALNGSDDFQIVEAMGFYDYIEIMPAQNSSFLIREGRLADLDAIKDVNKRIVALAKKAGKPFVATGDVHYIKPSDAVYRQVLLAGQDFKDVQEQPPLHLRTTEEMLEEFSYLGLEDCLEAVIIAPNRIADSVDSLKPVPDGLFTPVLKGAEEQVRDKTISRAESLYGSPLPAEVDSRIKKELHSIIDNGFASIYLVAMKLVAKSLEDGYLVGSRGSVGSSLVATLLGITEVNPLGPHYRCGSCSFSDFGPFGPRHGFDLPERICPRCGMTLKRDGHDIPFEVFLGFEGDKVPDIDLNFSGEYQPRIHKFSEEMFGSDNVFRAGTIGTIAEKTAYGFVRAYEEHTGKKASRAHSTRLAVGASGVRRTTGQHPGGIIVLPEGLNIHDFTPVQHPANSKEKGIITTHFEYTALHDNLLKLDLLGHDDPTMIKMLEDVTGRSFRDIPYDDEATMSIFSGIGALGLDGSKYGQEVGTIGIPEFGTRFVRGMLADTRPRTFDELVRISGLSHGTNVWLDNAQEVIRSGDGTLKDVISVRDDIMNYLISKGMGPKYAFQIMENVRKGKGLSYDDEKAMSGFGVPAWYSDSCNKIKYMFPKAHACAYVMMAFRIAFAKVHMPAAFYSAYLSIRATDFDPAFARMGVRELEKLMRSIDSNKAATQKEKDTVPIVEVIREALMRGISLKPVNLALSDPLKFVSEADGIRVPLLSVARLGQKPSLAISEARKDAQFGSVEELKERAKLGKAHIDALRESGALEGLRESMHMELF